MSNNKLVRKVLVVSGFHMNPEKNFGDLGAIELPGGEVFLYLPASPDECPGWLKDIFWQARKDHCNIVHFSFEDDLEVGPWKNYKEEW